MVPENRLPNTEYRLPSPDHRLPESAINLTPRQNAYTPENRAPVNLWAIVLFSAYLILASWLFGGVEGWSRAVLFYGGLLVFLILFCLPTSTGQPLGYRQKLVSLLKFPVFWLGLFLFIYVGLQFSNPDFRYVSGLSQDGSRPVWWLSNEGLEPKADWPTSIEAPTARGNPISFLYRYAGAWFLVLAIRLVPFNRRGWEILLTVLTANLFVYALVALAQDISGTQDVLWFREWPIKHFSGVFFYTNHGGAFLYFGACIASALLLRWMKKQAGDPDSSIRCLFPLIVMGMASVAAIASGSRAAWIGVGATWSVLLFLGFLRILGDKVGAKFRNLLLLLVVPVVFVGVGWYFLDHDYIEMRWETFEQQLEQPLKDNPRIRGYRISWAMHEDRPIFGYGADSYLHAAAFYHDLLKQSRFLWETRNRDRRGTMWQGAHNDTLQYLVELGWVGIIPILAIWLYWIFVLLWNILRISLYDLAILAGLFFLWLHSFIDIIFLSSTMVILFAFFLSSVAGIANSERRVGSR